MNPYDVADMARGLERACRDYDALAPIRARGMAVAREYSEEALDKNLRAALEARA